MNVIAVHAGAGYQAEDKKDAYFKLLSKAADAGINSFLSGPNPVDAVVAAIAVLEDSPLTNAGTGSNLNYDGAIECDASIMEGENLKWAGVGAIPNIKNPILVAKELLENQSAKQPCGLIPPMSIMGNAAKTWALRRNISCEAKLVTEKNEKTFKKYQERLAKSEAKNGIQDRLDTVGAVAINSDGVSAAAVSSGGFWMKCPGRVGQAASFASGVWAEDGVAVTTSGVGEFIIRTQLAKVISDSLLNTTSSSPAVDIVKKCMEDNFIHSRYLRDVDFEDRMAGSLTLIRDKDSRVTEVVACHSTPSMVFGYKTSKMRTTQTYLTRRELANDQSLECCAFMT